MDKKTRIGDKFDLSANYRIVEKLTMWYILVNKR